MIQSLRHFVAPRLSVSSMLPLLALITLTSMRSTNAAESSPDALCVMTYNLRYANDNPGEAWTTRRPLIAETIRTIAPDVFGTQEGLYRQLLDIEADLAGYAWIGLGRAGGSRDEFTAIFYRTARLEPLAFDHFWLSDTPDVVGSMTWGNRYRRMVTWVNFRDKVTRREFAVWNTHFDHEVETARQKSAVLIRERIAQLAPGLPVLLLGDFNVPAGTSEVFRTFTQDGFFVDAWTTAATPPALPKTGTATFNGFGTFELGDARIDWILTRGPWQTEKIEIITFARDGQFPSDHFPVVARIAWRE